MNDTNGDGFVEIPDPGTMFRVGEQIFSLDLVEALRTINRITAECEGKNNFEHLEAFARWVCDETKIALTLSQADWLWDYIQQQYVVQKKMRRAELSLPRFTGLTPSD